MQMVSECPGSTMEELSRGWRLLLIATLGMGISVTGLPFYAAGVFVLPLEQAFGWSRSEIAGFHVALFLAVGTASPIAGRLIDKLGARTVVIASMLAMAACFLGLGAINGSRTAYLAIAAAMGALGAGASAIAFTRVVTLQFHTARGLALGICLMGSGVFATMAPPILEAIIADAGWRWAYRGLAMLMLAMAPVMLLLGPATRAVKEEEALQRSLQDRALEPAAASASFLTSRRFWALFLGLNATGLAIVGTSYHLVPMLTEILASPLAAASYASVMGIAVLVSRPISGLILDRIFAPYVGAAISVCGLTACLLLAQAPQSASALTLAVVLLGMTLGAEFDLGAYLTSRYFPAGAYGRIYGVLFGFSTLLTAIGPFAVARLYEIGSSYSMPLLVMAASCAISIPALLLLGPYPSPEDNRDAPS